MAVVDDLEFYGRCVDEFGMDRSDAVRALVRAREGGLTEQGARDAIRRRREARAQYAEAFSAIAEQRSPRGPWPPEFDRPAGSLVPAGRDGEVIGCGTVVRWWRRRAGGGGRFTLPGSVDAGVNPVHSPTWTVQA
ncbi:hypothetical protein ACIQ7D_02880 [Streptomyces sp. NPDC096310]|uniref:hypothetical protein n=1 Tax=Streptomyces sp. NPDC096310 TaxID=3366082 RepID=UPI003827C124